MSWFSNKADFKKHNRNEYWRHFQQMEPEKAALLRKLSEQFCVRQDVCPQIVLLDSEVYSSRLPFVRFRQET